MELNQSLHCYFLYGRLTNFLVVSLSTKSNNLTFPVFSHTCKHHREKITASNQKYDRWNDKKMYWCSVKCVHYNPINQHSDGRAHRHTRNSTESSWCRLFPCVFLRRAYLHFAFFFFAQNSREGIYPSSHVFLSKALNNITWIIMAMIQVCIFCLFIPSFDGLFFAILERNQFVVVSVLSTRFNHLRLFFVQFLFWSC